MADVKYTAEEMRKLPDQTNWEALLAMEDEDIVCDEESPDVMLLLKQGHARMVGRGSIDDPAIREAIRQFRQERKPSPKSDREKPVGKKIPQKQIV